MPHLELSLLGAFRVTLDGRLLTAFESDKVRALLAYLALEGTAPHRRELLAGLLWPEQTDERARAGLSQALYNLRGLLGDRSRAESPPPGQADQPSASFLLVTPHSVQFNPASDYRLDVAVFSELLEQCREHTHARLEGCEACQPRLEAAVALYQGDLLADFSLGDNLGFDEWALVWRERLWGQAVGALEQLAGYHARRGETETALAYSRRQVRLDPLGEAGHRQVMRLLALQGQLQEALAQYALCQHILQTELGTETSQETQALAGQLRLELEGTPPAAHLPAALTPFIGRRAELAELGGLLGDPACRLVTVLGAGGSGKTRLALELARSLRYDYPHGVHYIPLSALSSADELVPAIAAALQFTFRDGSDPRSQLLDYLGGKRMLLVLDSFETVLAGAGWLVELLRAAPGVKALVTSRARLNVKAEHIFPLGGMRYPREDELRQAHQYSAVQLFASGVERAHPGFKLDEAVLPQAARICQLVGGMPLGVLLASAWVETMPLDEIATQIGRSLDFLSVDWQDVPERQRSLRATFEYSWQLLQEQEREMLAGLSVFRASFTYQAAAQVVGVTAQTLRGFMEKTMLLGALGGRYQMHDLLHQFAGQKLAERGEAQQAVHQRHSEYYLAKLVNWREDMNSARQMEALLELDQEIPDARLALLQTAAGGNWNELERAVEGLCRFYELRCRYTEGESTCREMLERMGQAPTQQPGSQEGRAWLLAWQTYFYIKLGKLGAAARLLEEARVFMEWGKSGAGSQRTQALIWLEGGLLEKNREAGGKYLRDSLALFRKADEPHWVAVVLCELEKVASANGDLEGGLHAASEAVVIMRRLGDRRGIANSLNRLSYWHSVHGYFEQALAEMQEAVELYHSLGDRIGAAEGYRHMGIMLGWNGRFAEAVELVERSLPLYREMGERGMQAYCTLVLSLGELLLGNYAQATRLGHEALELCRAGEFQYTEAASLTATGCAMLGQGDHRGGLALLKESALQFQRMHNPDEKGWALGGISLAYHGLGQPEQARQKLGEALCIMLKVKGGFALISGLPAAALLLVEEGKLEMAAEVCALVRRMPCVYNSPWFEDIAGRRVDERLAELPQHAREAAERRGREGDPYALMAEVLEIFQMEKNIHKYGKI